MIETSSLTRNFNGIKALENLTISIPGGEVFGLLGPNGAGKTTAIRILCCLISPTSGSAFIDGIEIDAPGAGETIRSKIGLLPEHPGLYESLTARQNLEFYAEMHGVARALRKSRIEELLRLLDIWSERDRTVATFSKGMRQKIAIARALVHDPKILFLDEPTSGLDPMAAKVVRDFIAELSKEHERTVFINTHNLPEAERLCDRVGILKTRLIAIGSPEELPRTLWKRRCVVQFSSGASVDEEELRSLEGVRSVLLERDRLTAEVDDPDLRIPQIVSLLVSRGARITHASEVKRSLEDAYLELVGAM